MSSEPDQIFESYAGTALRKVLKMASAEQRDNQEWLTQEVNKLAGNKFDRVGYQLLDVNIREDALTPIGMAVKAWPGEYEPYSPGQPDSSEPDNVVALPHQVPFAAVDLGLGSGQSS